MRKIEKEKRDSIILAHKYKEKNPDISGTKLAKKFGVSRKNTFFTKKEDINMFKYYFEEDDCYYYLDEKEEEAIRLYTSDETITKAEIRRRFGYEAETFNKKLRVAGHSDERRYAVKFDRGKFNSIKTEEEAYWLGFLIADGYNNQDRGATTLKLGAVDEGHLVKYCLFMKADPEKRIMDDYGGSNQIIKYVNLNSREFSDNLAKWGVTQNKSTNEKFPEIDPALMKPFLRGFFDGDGGFSNNTERGKIDRLQVVGGEEFLIRWKEEVEKGSGIEINPIYRKQGELFSIIISGMERIKRVSAYLYEGSNIYLDRKYEQYLELQKQPNDGRV